MHLRRSFQQILVLKLLEEVSLQHLHFEPTARREQVSEQLGGGWSAWPKSFHLHLTLAAHIGCDNEER